MQVKGTCILLTFTAGFVFGWGGEGVGQERVFRDQHSKAWQVEEAFSPVDGGRDSKGILFSVVPRSPREYFPIKLWYYWDRDKNQAHQLLTQRVLGLQSYSGAERWMPRIDRLTYHFRAPGIGGDEVEVRASPWQPLETVTWALSNRHDGVRRLVFEGRVLEFERVYIARVDHSASGGGVNGRSAPELIAQLFRANPTITVASKDMSLIALGVKGAPGLLHDVRGVLLWSRSFVSGAFPSSFRIGLVRRDHGSNEQVGCIRKLSSPFFIFNVKLLCPHLFISF